MVRFCRLRVDDIASSSPGCYAWVLGERVMYLGRAGQLRQIVHGQRMGRAPNDYTYVAPSEPRTAPGSPRVRINGLLNRALVDGAGAGVVTWWWVATADTDGARRLEARLISEWDPPWNRARPLLVNG